MIVPTSHPSFFFFNDTATTEIYTLSLHDALPILAERRLPFDGHYPQDLARDLLHAADPVGQTIRVQQIPDRKSTRLNSSHLVISYAVFCLKKKNTCVKSRFYVGRGTVTPSQRICS